MNASSSSDHTQPEPRLRIVSRQTSAPNSSSGSSWSTPTSSIRPPTSATSSPSPLVQSLLTKVEVLGRLAPNKIPRLVAVVDVILAAVGGSHEAAPAIVQSKPTPGWKGRSS